MCVQFCHISSGWFQSLHVQRYCVCMHRNILFVHGKMYIAHRKDRYLNLYTFSFLSSPLSKPQSQSTSSRGSRKRERDLEGDVEQLRRDMKQLKREKSMIPGERNLLTVQLRVSCAYVRSLVCTCSAVYPRPGHTSLQYPPKLSARTRLKDWSKSGRIKAEQSGP